MNDIWGVKRMRALLAVCVPILLCVSCQNDELVQTAARAATASEQAQTQLAEMRQTLDATQQRAAAIEQQIAELRKGLDALAGTPTLLVRLNETADKIKTKADLTAVLLETPMLKEKMAAAYPDCDNYSDIRVQIPPETSGISFTEIGVAATILSLDFACFEERPKAAGDQPAEAVFLLKTATTVAYAGKDKLTEHLVKLRSEKPYPLFRTWNEFTFRLLVRAMTDEGVVIAYGSAEFPVNRVLDRELGVPVGQMKAVKKIVAEWSYR